MTQSGEKFIENYIIRKEKIFDSSSIKHEPKEPKKINKEEQKMINKKIVNSQKIPCQYPFTAIGYIVCKTSDNKKIYGIGTLIYKNLVITCSSNCYEKTTKAQIRNENICFIPSFKEYESMHYTVKETYFLPDYSTENDYAILELVKDAGDDLGYLGLSWDSHNLMGNKQFDTFEYSIRFKEFCRKKIKYEVKEHEGKGKQKWQKFTCNFDEEEKKMKGNPILLNRQNELYVIGLVVGKELKGSYKEFRSDDIKQINQWLQVTRESLNLGYQSLDVDDMTNLAKGKWKNCTDLNLQKNMLRKQGPKELIQGSWKSIRYLNLSQNNIQSEGLGYLLRADWSKLIKLNLSHNNIDQQGLKRLSFQKLIKLEQINLQWNHFENTEPIIKAEWPSLKIILLSYCNIGVNGCQTLVWYEKWQSLEKLDIRYNNMDLYEREELEGNFSRKDKNKKGYIINLIV